MDWEERKENLLRVWFGKKTTARLEAWRNYYKDENSEMGDHLFLKGNKYQHLQGLNPDDGEDWEYLYHYIVYSEY